jgi:branched-chain amino acid transport system permease protein
MLVLAQSWNMLAGFAGLVSVGQQAFAGHVFGLRPAQATDVVCYWLALALAMVTIGFAYRLLRSRQGLALAAVRDNQEAARSIGVDARWLKTFVYLAAGFLSGLAGALIYVQKARISPDAAFSVVDWTAYVIFIVVIGGIGTIEGPMIGVLVFFLLQNMLADYGSWYLLVLGLIGIIVMLFAPQGLCGLFGSRSGIQLFPVRRMLRGGPISMKCKGGPHG